MLAIKKIGLALGGGGAKGAVHIGIIKALLNAGIKIDYIAGTSMGALVGGFYAATGDIDKLENLIISFKKSDIFSLKKLINHKDGAFFKEESVTEKLRKELKDAKIENLNIPFTALATDIKNGNEIRLGEGDLVDAIRASIALPVIFAPVKIGDSLLIDGGLVNPVPADVVKDMGAKYVIAVDVSSKWLLAPEELITTHDVYHVISSAFSIIEYQIAKTPLKSADIVLRPPVLNYDWMDFGKSEELIKIGKRELELNLKEIRRQTGHKKTQETIAEKFFDFILNSPHT